MFNLIRVWITAGLFLCLLPGSAQSALLYHFGQAITEAQVSSWNIDINPDGTGLPPGEATADDGEDDYIQMCSSCHGEFGEGLGTFPRLVGTQDELTEDRVHKTVGGYWPYATTLWDYINRAMPFGNAQSLTAKQVYGLVAYILYMNEIIESDVKLNAKTLPAIKMPNRNGFVLGDYTDIQVPACMSNCSGFIKIKSQASPTASDHLLGE